MSSKISLVTFPDDLTQDGLRICLVGLNQSQTSIISDSLNLLDYAPDTIIYIWNGENYPWLMDKKLKSDLLIFNAEYENQELIGYFSAQPNAYYLGNLKTLGIINKRIIHDVDQLILILKESIIKYEQQFE
jgi:hypothetical protein